MKAVKLLCVNLVVFILSSCGTEHESKKLSDNNENGVNSASAIVDSSYQFYGADVINEKSVTFDFRKHEYRYVHSDSGLVRQRILKESSDSVVSDVWYENELQRFINGDPIELTGKEEKAYKNSINSVFYFAFLPKNLKDPAVNLSYMDEVRLNGKLYHKIKVTFDQEGGGEDYQDVYLYWFDQKDYSMDYLAYSYITEGGGMRFRSFKNRRRFQGIAFQDYINYKPKSDDIGLEYTDQAFERGNLTEVSRIELENVRVD